LNKALLVLIWAVIDDFVCGHKVAGL